MTTSNLDALCIELCEQANIDIATIRSGATMEIPASQLIALAEAYDRRKAHYNYRFGIRLRKPLSEESTPMVWNKTLGIHWNIPLSSFKRGPRVNRFKRHYINYE